MQIHALIDNYFSYYKVNMDDWEMAPSTNLLIIIIIILLVAGVIVLIVAIANSTNNNDSNSSSNVENDDAKDDNNDDDDFDAGAVSSANAFNEGRTNNSNIIIKKDKCSSSDGSNIPNLASSSDESERLNLDELARQQDLASVEDIALYNRSEDHDYDNSDPSSTELFNLTSEGAETSSNQSEKSVESPRPRVVPYTPIGSESASDQGGNDETSGVSIEPSVSNPAAFSSDFSSQTELSTRPAQRRNRSDPLNGVRNLNKPPQMGPLK